MVLGLLLIPLSAYAASVLVIDRAQTEPGTPPPAASPFSTSVTTTDFAIETATAADLAAACGETGMGMVAAEMDGSISDIQQAALDALREICAEQGMPLPGKPAPEPHTQTVVLADSQPAGSADSGTEIGWEVEYDDDLDDEWDDDDHDDEGHD
ncbi:MAG TPA: hypothetical protein VK990_08875, partial [Acidimicrobiia bacterium]|nr:hypothetical protein [Acidimicrobiia bacterium]